MTLGYKSANLLFELLTGLFNPTNGPGGYISISKEDTKGILLELATIINAEAEKPKNVVQGVGLYEFSFPHEKKVVAIKWVRELTGLGLKEAKDLVESNQSPSSYVSPNPVKFKLPLKESVFTAELPKFKALGVLNWEYLGPQYPSPPPAPTPVFVERTCFLVFKRNSKTVKAFAEMPPVIADEVAVEVTAKIPLTAFDPIRIRAEINLPDGGGLTSEAFVDLQQAVEMTYGKTVQLIVQAPSNPPEINHLVEHLTNSI